MRLKRIANLFGDQGQALAFVSTMGALHSGHIALINDANAHAQNVLASIFR
ncbi:MAG: pantoate--beta-alanine ligase [Candidatus Oxydemutatoraceae bacterium WSBS_2016_MAG_OTU14]